MLVARTVAASPVPEGHERGLEAQMPRRDHIDWQV